MKLQHNNRISLLFVPIIILFFLGGEYIVTGHIDRGISGFLIFVAISVTMSVLWNNHYYTSFEQTLQKFINIHHGTVELVAIQESHETVNYIADGSYNGRPFHMTTHYVRRNKSGDHVLDVQLGLNAPFDATFKLIWRWRGKVNLEPVTIADIYVVEFFFNHRQKRLLNVPYHLSKLRDEFIIVADQHKLGRKLARLGKKYRGWGISFQISVNEESIGVKRIGLIRSIDELEELVSMLDELAGIIEELAYRDSP